MALKRTYDEMNSNRDSSQAYNAEPDEGGHDFSSLSKEDRSRAFKAIHEHLRKRKQQLERSLHKNGQSQDQPVSFSSLKSVDAPLNFLSIGSGDHSYRSPQAHVPVQGCFPRKEVRLQSNTGDMMRQGEFEERRSNTQLTIFYSGVVKVYDNVPSDEAYAIMLLAGTGSSLSPQRMSSQSTESNSCVPSSSGGRMLPTAGLSASASTDREESSASMSLVPQLINTKEMKQLSLRRTYSELPVTRKASLGRFLEERKERLLRDKLAGNLAIDYVTSQIQETDQTLARRSDYPKMQCLRSPLRMGPRGGLDGACHRQSTAPQRVG